ncbi:MAG: DHH family phosphoesterase [Bacteroidetes bacterium]|nr:DHH family phosphoesterase [Bacteroidota bacterium]
MTTFDFNSIEPLFHSEKKIFLTSHSNPDGDALGALLALFHFFTRKGHEVNMMVPNNFPGFLQWMPGSDQILIYKKDTEVCDQLFRTTDLLFSLDYNSPSRINGAEKAFRQSQAIKILIDHHIDPEKNAYNHCFSTTLTSSTSELVFQMMNEMNGSLIDKKIADCIFTGIMTDTGSFSYNCNYKSTFQIVSELIGKGLQTDEINRLVYATNTENRIRLLGFSLSEKLVVLAEQKTAYIALSREELNRYNYQTGDTEGLVNYALSVVGIRFAALFTERGNKIRISFRSTGNFSVNEFARDHFLGGGHRNAAGGDSFDDLKTTIAKFEALLPRYADKI